MRFLKLLIYGFFVLLFLIFLIPVFLPSSVELSRSISMKAEARQVFRLVNNFENWKLWSPFQLDLPEIEARISNPAIGEGSSLVYRSNTSGESSITIIESHPYRSIKMMLGMQKGGIAVDEWQFEQTGDTVVVTWTLRLSELKYPFHRYFGFFSRSLMSPFQEKGLEKLKEVATQLPPAPPSDTIMFEGFAAIVTEAGSTGNLTNDALNESAAALQQYLKRLRTDASGDLFGLYDGRQALPPVNAALGYPVAEETRESGMFRYIEVAGGKAVTTTLVGPPAQRHRAYDELELYLREFRLEHDSTRPLIEFYSPSAGSPDSQNDMVTRIIMFLKEKNKPE
ncbi:MAG TPA: SRPBCC family protein [Bacteroidales bacterium]|nr:SRPBCC family protein [Bacteroidales bacterium]